MSVVLSRFHSLIFRGRKNYYEAGLDTNLANEGLKSDKMIKISF